MLLFYNQSRISLFIICLMSTVKLSVSVSCLSFSLPSHIHPQSPYFSSVTHSPPPNSFILFSLHFYLLFAVRHASLLSVEPDRDCGLSWRDSLCQWESSVLLTVLLAVKYYDTHLFTHLPDLVFSSQYHHTSLTVVCHFICPLLCCSVQSGHEIEPLLNVTFLWSCIWVFFC